MNDRGVHDRAFAPWKAYSMLTSRFHFFRPAREGVDLRDHWLEVLARVGHLAKGIVYGLIGLLAVRMALTAARSPDARDALQTVLQAPFGRILLTLVTLGLVAYSCWRFVQAWADTDNKGDDLKGLTIRGGFIIAGLANLALALLAGLTVWRGVSSGGSDSSTREQAAQTVLSFPGGWILLVGLGLILVGVGVGHFFVAYNAAFMKDFEFTEMSQWERDWVKPVGQAGLAARGVIFCLIGLFMVIAGWQKAAGKIKGLGEAFTTLASQPFGQVLLGLVALGFIAYGVHCVSLARYRHIARV